VEVELAAGRLLVALDMYEAGEELLRQRLRRRFPTDDEAAIEARIEQWLATRPGAEEGDAAGRVVPPARLLLRGIPR
jgi:hypothetical protein